MATTFAAIGHVKGALYNQRENPSIARAERFLCKAPIYHRIVHLNTNEAKARVEPCGYDPHPDKDSLSGCAFILNNISMEEKAHVFSKICRKRNEF